ncbi:MAG: hypothetical protein HY696_10525 [Deltaproteobacteria bacterium]|nr:hypothetical protein [Deltaproteobacteria bacterium]
MAIKVPGMALQQGVARALHMRPRLGPAQPGRMIEALRDPHTAHERFGTTAISYSVAGARAFHTQLQRFAGPVAHVSVTALGGMFAGDDSDPSVVDQYFRCLSALLIESGGVVAGLLPPPTPGGSAVAIDRAAAVARLWHCALITEVTSRLGLQYDVISDPDRVVRLFDDRADWRAAHHDFPYLRQEHWVPLMMTLYQGNDTMLDLITAGAAGPLFRFLHRLAFEPTATEPALIPREELVALRQIAEQGHATPLFLAGDYSMLASAFAAIRVSEGFPLHRQALDTAQDWCARLGGTTRRQVIRLAEPSVPRALSPDAVGDALDRALGATPPPPPPPAATPRPAPVTTADPPPDRFAVLQKEIDQLSPEEADPYRDDRSLAGRILSHLWVRLNRAADLDLQTDPRLAALRAVVECFAQRVDAGLVTPEAVSAMQRALTENYIQEILRILEADTNAPDAAKIYHDAIRPPDDGRFLMLELQSARPSLGAVFRRVEQWLVTTA